MNRVETENHKHSFHCDKCGKYLGTSQEHNDGYYSKLGEFNLSFYLPGGWYKFDKCFCDDCRNKFLEKLENNLKDMGFSIDME